MGKLVFVWDNFGPLHADRCNAVAKKFQGTHQVIGLELAGRSKVYDWIPEKGTHFKKITLITGRSFEDIPFAKRFGKTLDACLRVGRDSLYFLCHYQDPAIFLLASTLRAMGRSVYTEAQTRGRKVIYVPSVQRSDCVWSTFLRLHAVHGTAARQDSVGV
jgi:L-malate glycosyltransferase